MHKALYFAHSDERLYAPLLCAPSDSIGGPSSRRNFTATKKRTRTSAKIEDRLESEFRFHATLSFLQKIDLDASTSVEPGGLPNLRKNLRQKR